MLAFHDLAYVLFILISYVYDCFIEFHMFIVRFESLYVYMILCIIKNQVYFVDDYWIICVIF